MALPVYILSPCSNIECFILTSTTICDCKFALKSTIFRSHCWHVLMHVIRCQAKSDQAHPSSCNPQQNLLANEAASCSVCSQSMPMFCNAAITKPRQCRKSTPGDTRRLQTAKFDKCLPKCASSFRLMADPMESLPPLEADSVPVLQCCRGPPVLLPSHHHH